MSDVLNRKDLWKFVDKLRKILEEGGEASINWSVKGSCLIFALDRCIDDPQNKPRFAVFVYDERKDDWVLLIEKWIDGKIELKVVNPEWTRAFARDKGEVADFFVRGRIEVKVNKMREIERTNVEVVCKR